MKKSAQRVLGFLLATTAATAQQYVIDTIAGGAPPRTPAQGTAFAIDTPGGVAADASGNVYFTGFNCVFKLDPSGVVTLIAGNSRRGYSGDGGPATDAQLDSPSSVAVDGAGNLFIVEFGRVRRVSPGGIITTVAGGGSSSSSRSSDGGPATDAQLGTPVSVAVDGAGNLFIADQSGRSIRKVSFRGIITTVASGSALGGNPTSVAVDSAGNVFFTEAHAVRKVAPDGTVTAFAGGSTGGYSGDGGPAENAQLYSPEGLALDRAGNLFIAEWGSRIRKVSPSGIITTFAGGGTPGFSGDDGPAQSAQLDRAAGVAADGSGNLYISDLGNNRIRRISASGIITTAAGTGDSGHFSGDGGPATSAQLNSPFDVTTDSVGNLFIFDYGNSRIRKVSRNGIISTLITNEGLGFPNYDPYTASPSSAKANAAGELFVPDSYHNRVLKISTSATVTAVAGVGSGPVAVDSGDNLFVFDSRGLQKVAPNGIVSTIPRTTSILEPGEMAADDSGNLFIGQFSFYAIFKVSSNGVTTSAIGTRARPASGMTVNRAGELFFIDAVGINPFAPDSVRKLTPSGIVSTVAGGSPGYSGDGGPASSAKLSPWGAAADGAGNIYVAEPINNAIRVLRPTIHNVLIGAVVDAASQRATPLSPGKIVVIYGAGLGPSQLMQPANGQPVTSLGGTTVAFNGIPATILYTSATQVAALVPYTLTGTSAQVTVTYQSEASEAFAQPVAPSAPGIFTSNLTGAGQAAAINVLDGTVNSAKNPVKIGGYISLYATGEGQTTGSPAHPLLPVSVTIGGIPATVQYAGAAPGQVAGLIQVNVQIPAGVQPGGYVPVVLQVGDSSTTDGAVWIAVAAN
jgi:uncharacterized protein (TIGR03437 family)